MADKQISELTAVSALGDSDLFVVQQSGAAKKATGSNVGSYISGKHYWRFPKVQKLASDTLVAIDPFKYYVFPEMSLLTISYSATDPDTTNAREYRFRFSSGNTPTVLNLPASVHGNLVPEANKTYDVTIYDNYLTYTEYNDGGWEAIQYMVRNGTIGNVYSVGDTIPCAYRGGTITWKIIGIDEETPSNPEKTHSLTLEMVEGVNDIRLNQYEAVYYAAAGLSAGSYKFELENVMYYFTISSDLPEGGQICIYSWSGSGNSAVPLKLVTYAHCYTTTAIQSNITLSTTAIAGATELTGINSIARAHYGYNEWSTSVVRRWLCSKEEAGNVFVPDNNFSRIPPYIDGEKGFLNGFDDDFLSVIGYVQKSTVNPAGTLVTSNELVFLPSITELYGGKNITILEGTPYSYYEDNSSLSQAGTGEDTNRIKYINGTPIKWMIRSLVTGAEYNRIRYIREEGNTSYAVASTSFAVFPIVCIM